MDEISRLIGRDSISSHVFYNDNFCGSNDFVSDGKTGQLHLIRAGVIEFLYEGQPALRIDMPTLLFYPRGLAHRLHAPVGKSARLLCANIFFEGGNQNLLVRALPEILRHPLHESSTMKGIVDLLFHEADLHETGQDVILDRLCDVLVIQLIRHESRIGSLTAASLLGLTDPRLSRVLSAIHEEPQGTWRLDALARIAGMSRSKFALYFHQVVGMPPGEYLIHRRLAVAQDLLRKGLPVKAVCHRVGYTNQPAFTRMFKGRAGMSPRAWLASLHESSSRGTRDDF
ncbi:AraC family transcriptional regulator [Massilia horti]|uniref:AraC family transcriptional regulator n=1 Tax=Massilia horti TaxID=2562153 RepID=A0A4Y9T912_9BURK|nr:AraC family transcriptional regulator [Massilia horti]TFW34558.1 AraC family transcriptional regulator [Massilia horti]